jgi:predicted glycosyltransferase involved in capsule biosynthesis
MLDLTKTTFIIPIKIEHPDRYRNARNVLGFLNSNMKTNVFIYESSHDGNSRLDFLDDLKNLKIKKWNISNEQAFHRTKYLNVMLDSVETPVVINYDIDVILDPLNYKECEDMITSGIADVIFPYENGIGQQMVENSFDYSGFVDSNYSIDFLNSSNSRTPEAAECGHCMFFNTDVYKKRCGENENFISYGPEDKERMYRFQKLGHSVLWRQGKYVYHFEHYRGSDSWISNPYFDHNWSVFNSIKSMNDNDLISYYENQDYRLQYKTIGNK